jgi:AcrR family transcriptional regulator
MRKKGNSKGLPRSDKWISVIANAAARLFSSKGYLETSMEDVATAAGISKGGMYYYFSSKGDLLFFIVSGFMDMVLKDLEEELPRIDLPEDRIRFLVLRHVTTYADYMYSAKVLISEAFNLPAARLKQIRQKERKYYNIISDVLSPELGPSPDKNVLTAATFNLIGMCNWIYRWYNPKGAITPECMAQIIFENFTKGFSSLTGVQVASDEASARPSAVPSRRSPASR